MTNADRDFGAIGAMILMNNHKEDKTAPEDNTAPEESNNTMLIFYGIIATFFIPFIMIPIWIIYAIKCASK